MDCKAGFDKVLSPLSHIPQPTNSGTLGRLIKAVSNASQSAFFLTLNEVDGEITSQYADDFIAERAIMVSMETFPLQKEMVR